MTCLVIHIVYPKYGECMLGKIERKKRMMSWQKRGVMRDSLLLYWDWGSGGRGQKKNSFRSRDL
jgi:hypothetical protein